ncbi:MAG TPA: HsdR family type I site-specific deoxyribonuclease [Verrucomicrobiae bacterium]
MPLGSESSSVQRPFVRYAVAAGWTYLSPDDALALRNGGTTSPVLDGVLVAQLQKLNPKVLDAAKAAEAVRRLVRVRPTIEGNLDAWEFLRGLKTVFVEAEKRERNVRFMDAANPGANMFHVTEEFTFSNGIAPDMRADIVFFINGVPVLIVETKKATAMDGIAQALDDIRYYHRKGPEFLALNQLHALTHLIQFYYGATWNTSAKALFNWRDEAAGNFEALCRSFLQPVRVLKVIADFILFTRKDEELTKVVLRPHQMRAAGKCAARAKDKKRKRGLVWHTQGSGKTYSMIVTAKLLISDPVFENPTVLLLVDRNELEAQLFGNLESVGFGHVEVAESKEHLRKLLKQDHRGLIVSMIHKFDGMPADMNKRSNIYVLVDEAHRTTGGDLGNYLMGALPNATFLGFTGTPIDRTAQGKGTFKVFGFEDEKGYLDKYSIKESIQDGTTVPLHYALAPNELRVDRETLEKEFLNLAEAEGVSDFEALNKILEQAVTLRNMLKNRDRVEKVAAYVAKHFRENVEPMGYKAFLVAVDREACCFYKEALDKHLPPGYSQVVISQGGKKDADHLKRHYLSDDDEKAVRKEFRKPDAQPKILIVTEKLLTGFDAPILYAMYLDKPMRDHVLLQAIARVNRPYEDGEQRRKPCGFVLDFVGIFEKLEKALAFDSQDVTGVIEGVEVLQARFADLMDTGRSDYLPILAGKKADKQVEAVLEHFRDRERREVFYAYFRELQDIYEILSPDPFLRPFLADFNELLRMFHLVRAAYERGQPVDKEFLRKTAKLVQKHTESGAIEASTKFQALTVSALEAIADSKQPDTVKVFNLLKALEGLVSAKGGMEPYLISIGDRADEIAAAFEDRQMETQKALEELHRLIRAAREAQKLKDETRLSPEAFAVFYVLKMDGVKDPLQAARSVEAAFEQHPHWQTSEAQEREVRKSIFKALIDAGVEAIAEVADKLMKLLRRAKP